MHRLYNHVAVSNIKSRVHNHFMDSTKDSEVHVCHNSCLSNFVLWSLPSTVYRGFRGVTV